MESKEHAANGTRGAKALRLREEGVLCWRFLAVFSLAGCIAIEVLYNILPIDHDTLLLYWFYPVSLLTLSQLYVGLRYAKKREIRFLLAYFAWMCVCVVLNYGRAHLLESYTWFAATCAALFLCYSLPYAFDKDTAGHVLTVLAITTVLSASLLCAVSLIAIYAPAIAEKAPSVFEGIGFWDGRLSIDIHPNRSSPPLAAAIVLAGYLIARAKRPWQRVLWVLCALICYIPLSLTVSRTAIIAAGLAVGFEVFLALRVRLRAMTKTLQRTLLCAAAGCVALVLLYKGAELVGQANNAYFARVEAAAQQEAAVQVAETAPQATEAEEAAAQPEAAAAPETQVADRGLTGVDSFSGRTDIWLGVWNGLKENPRILLFGTGPAVAGNVMAPYFPEGSPVGLFHNSLMGALVSFGVVGLLLAAVFLVFTAVFAWRLSFGQMDDAESLAVRMLPAMLLFTLAEAMMEDFLFASLSLNIVLIWFMIAAGFAARLAKREPSVDAERAA